MNINQRIDELNQGGIPRYNRKINELIETVNWLMGMRSDSGQPISEGGRGPVIPTGNVAVAAGATPWTTDPDGNAAGWTLTLALDLDGAVTGFTNSMYMVWTWTGSGVTNLGQIPWMVTPGNETAGWAQHDVCVAGVVTQKWFWGQTT
jgi:hypothetical protein